MNAVLATLLLLADPHVDPAEVQAVLEWTLREPPPISKEAIERIVTAALASDEPLAPEIRRELLLRRGMVRIRADRIEDWAGADQDLAECHKLNPGDLFVESYRLVARLRAGVPSGQAAVEFLQDAERLVRENPNSALARWTLGHALFGQRPPDYPRILRLLNESVQLDPNLAVT